MKFTREPKHGDVTGGFNSSSLERSMEHVRNAFLACITMLQSGEDPKPYLITSYALTLIGNYEVRDAIINEFENGLDSLEDGRYSPAGIRECIAVWAAISEYMGMFGTDKKLTVMGESTDYNEEDETHFSDEDLPLYDENKSQTLEEKIEASQPDSEMYGEESDEIMDDSGEMEDDSDEEIYVVNNDIDDYGNGDE